MPASQRVPGRHRRKPAAQFFVRIGRFEERSHSGQRPAGLNVEQVHQGERVHRLDGQHKVKRRERLVGASESQPVVQRKEEDGQHPSRR